MLRNNKGKKSGKGKGRKGSKRKATRGSRWAPQTSRTSTVTRTRVAPDEMDVKLMFRETVTLANAFSAIMAKSYHTNAAYDVDPSLGSTETYGFDEYAALYSYYRVIGYSYKIQCVNKTETGGVGAPIMAYVLNTNIDATTVGSHFSLFSTNPYCQSRIVSDVSPNITTFKGSHKISQIVGSPAPETTDSFRSLTTAVPSDLTWITICAEALSGAVINTIWDFKLVMHIRFYGREIDLTLSAQASKLNAMIVARQELNDKKRSLQRQKSQKALEDKNKSNK